MTDHDPARDGDPSDDPSSRSAEDRPFVPRDLGLPGAVLLSWIVAGGILAGGFLVAYATLTARMSGNALLYTSGGLYLFGALIGLVLGGAVGMFGRPVEMTVSRAFKDQAMALLYALPAVIVGFTVAGWIAMTVMAIFMANALPLLGVSVAYAVGLFLIALAVRFGWFGTRNAWHKFRTALDRLGDIRVDVRFETDGDREPEATAG